MPRTLIAAAVIVATLQPVPGSPLTEAAAAGKLEEVKRLLKAGAAVNELDSDGHLALQLTIKKNHSAVAHYLLEEASDLDLNMQEETDYGKTALMAAAKYGQPELGLELVRKGAALDVLNSKGSTALMFAAAYGQPELGLELVRKGAALDVRNFKGWTALMYAARYGQSELGLELVRKGAALDLQKHDGKTALMCAAQYRQPELGLELVRKGAALDLQDLYGWTALMLAAWSRQPELGLELVRKGAALDLQNHDGWTALMKAARYGCPELGQELLQRGADFRKRTYRAGFGALHLCAEMGEVHLAEAILDLGEDVDSRDASGRTALWLASLFGQERMARVLLQHGANAAIPASWGQTPEAVADSRELKHLLRQRVPGQLDLAFRLACFPDTWLHVGLGLLAGIAGAICTHCSTRGGCGLSAEQAADRPSKGATKLAHQAFAKRSKLRYYAALAHHAATSISSVVLPLGVAMLFIKPAAIVPLYALVYVATAVLCTSCRQFVTSPVLVITGASARGAARAVQAVATLALLVGVEAVQQECKDDISYYIEGNSHHKTPGKLAHFMVKGGQFALINAAAAPLACKGSSMDPFTATTRTGFDAYLLAIKMAALIWALSALVEAWSCKRFGVASPEHREEVSSLAARISATRSAGEVECLECDVAGVKVAAEHRWSIYFTVFMSLLDMFVLDFLTIFNLVMTYNTKFAGALTAITVMSSCSEILSGNLRRLLGDVKESVNRGVMPDGLVDFLSVEKGLEAPLSLAVTVYAFPFSIRGWPSLCTGLLSMGLSIYGCAQYLVSVDDEEEAADTTESEEETSSLTTSSSE